MAEEMVYFFQRFFREKEEENLRFPELSDGFLTEEGVEGEDAEKFGEPAGGVSGMNPVSFYTQKVLPGVYQVSMVLTAEEEIEKLYVFTGRKQLREILSLHQGEKVKRTYSLSAAEMIPRYQDKVYPVEHLFVTVCAREEGCFRLEECRARRCAGQKPVRIFLCGDSTVTDHAGEVPYCPGAGYAAWGQALPAFLPEAAVENQAHCGLTTEDFLKEGHFGIVLKFLERGDICLFQFGHNDQKLAHLWPNGEFLRNLQQFVEKVQESGGFPVLVTPLGRNIWDGEGVYLDLLKEHAAGVMELARTLEVPVIDLHGWSVDWIKRMGMEAARGYFHPGDYTHTNEYGAYWFAGFIAEELVKLFPGKLGKLEQRKAFIPTDGLWERLSSDGRTAEEGRGKEAFDQMEKSTSGLAEMIIKAREDSKRYGLLKEG